MFHVKRPSPRVRASCRRGGTMGRGARSGPLPSVPLPSPPLGRALCRSVVGGAHLSPGVGAAGGGDARSHGEDGFVLGRDRGCDGRPAVHRALRCASGAARFVGNVLTGGCGRAAHGPSLPLKRARGSPENAAVEQGGCRGWVPPLPHGQTTSPSVTCRESGARAEHESECRRGGCAAGLSVSVSGRGRERRGGLL